MINNSTHTSAGTRSTGTTETATPSTGTAKAASPSTGTAETTIPAPEAEALDSHQRQAKSAKALDHLLDQYRKLSDSERLKGNLFEQLVRQYLLLDSQMRTQFSEVYLWKDWPGNQGLPDTGIDLVAIQGGQGGEESGVVAIQCKFFAPTHRIQKKDIDSFLSESGKNPYIRRIVVETTGTAWSLHAEQAIVDQQIPVTRIGLTDLRNSDIDWASYRLSEPEQDASLQERKSPRDHQVSAITDVFKGFEQSDRGTLVMACGTGKTFTSLQIAERLADELGGSARVLFMVPSLSLMSQTLSEWASECSIGFEAWSVCSDTKVNRKRVTNNDIADMAVVDLKTPPTTDPKKLARSLHRHGDDDGLQVVFATYQSIDVVARAQVLGGSSWRDFDIIICDEAHRTTGVTLADSDDSAFVRIHNNAIIRADKRLYMTATPRLFNDKVKDAAKEKSAVLCSMDDQSIYGPVFHRLGFGNAVSLGLLTDYKVVVLAVPEDEVSGIYQSGVAESGELTLPETAKLVGCWNALSKRRGGLTDVTYGDDLTPMRRAVAFTKDIKTSKWVSQEFPSLVKEHLQDLTNDDETDNLEVLCEHVDGTMNAVQRGEYLDWLKDEADETDHPVCKILTNARCLSEGVDVPTLDAVLFLNPRKSQVDVIQAVGRVMRKAAGKEFGYIILPVAIPFGVSAEQALSDNKRYQVIWQVLQAIRAHDERFDNQINSIEFNKKDPTSIIVDVVNLSGSPAPVDHFSGTAHDDDGSGSNDSLQAVGNAGQVNVQTALSFNALEWKDGVFSLIVKKVGTRLYWDDWSKDIAEIATRFIALIGNLAEQPEHREAFTEFVTTLRKTLNPAIDKPQAIETLSQHIITKPLFDAMFPDQRFTEQNPVSRAMQGLLDTLANNAMFENERQPLAKFYDTMVEKIKGIDNVAGKQDIMRTLYDKFFSKAFPSMADRLGIVFTPVEVVDFILRSANDLLQSTFGKTLGDSGVSILEPFVGTGTFITRLLQLGLIPPEQLEYKYLNEIFGNEIVLLSYYIASINIETVYREIRKEQGFPDEYTEFPGLALTDTFQIYESDGRIEGLGDLQGNIDRVQRQKDANIKVIVMNPPYSAGQKSANDNNQNLRYEHIDRRIESTYAMRSTGTNKNSLYDSYFRALRWATDRIGDAGIIAFVSNNSFLDGNTADGVRLTFQDEFSDIYIYNLRGGIRGKIGDAGRREGGNIFSIMTGVAMTILVKRANHKGPALVHYFEVEDYLTAQEKTESLNIDHSVASTFPETDLRLITPNQHGDWISQRDQTFVTFQGIGDPKTKGNDNTPTLFIQYSAGLQTNRDAWCYNFSQASVASNIQRMISNYTEQLSKGFKDFDSTKISWSSSLDRYFSRELPLVFERSEIRCSTYRPFCRQQVYFDKHLNHRTYQIPKLFPSELHPNIAFGASGERRRDFSLLMTNALPDLEMVSKAQWCSLYTWSKSIDDGSSGTSLFDLFTSSTQEDAPQSNGTFDFTRPIGEQVPTWIDGYERRDNITDATLAAYREHYKDEHITKEDIFFYVYALLHHPTYRERYEADLKKMLPRIPKVTGFDKYSEIGRKLAHLHVNYEQIEPYPLDEEWKLDAPEDEWERYHVEKLSWGRRKDTSRLFYNDHLTLNGFPPEINEYQVGGRSPIEWMIDRYKITQDKNSGIVNDPNDYFREVGNPHYLVDLIKSLVTVSLRTQGLITELPDFVVDEEK